MKCIGSRLWTGRYISLLCNTFFVFVGFQMLIPTLTSHIKQLNGTDFTAGLAYSAAAAAALISRAVFGNKMDELGRKPFLLVGVGIITAVNLSLFVISDVHVICLLRFLQGIGWGLVSTALATITSDVVPAERMGEGIGYYALTLVLATSFSIILGIWLMNLSGFMLMLLFSTIFFVTCLVLSIGSAPVPFRRKEPTGRKGKSLGASLVERAALLPAFLCFLHSVAFSGIVAFIMLFGAESGIADIWIYFIGHLLMIVLSRPLVGKLFDRKGHIAVIAPGTLFLIAGLVLLSYSHSITCLVIASMLYGLGFGTVQPSLQAWAVNRSPADRKGAANGTFLSSLDLGYAAGTVLMGSIASMTSYAFMYRASSLLPVALLIVYGSYLIWSKELRTLPSGGKLVPK